MLFLNFPDDLLGLLMPMVVSKGFALLPEKAKPAACLIFAAGYSELKKAAVEKTPSHLDDKLVEETAEQVGAYMSANGFPNLFANADAFIKVGG